MPPRSTARTLGPLLVVLIAARAPSVRADIPVSTWAWGTAGLEVSGTAYAALRFGTHAIPEWGALSTAANVAPAVIGLGAGLAAYHWDLDARPALAAHGAIWGGLDLLLLGAAFEGRHQRDGLRAGRAAWALAGVGAIAGGALGATAGGHAPEVWLAAPSLGAIGGLLLGGLAVLASGDLGSDRSARRLLLGTCAGVTLGLAGAAIYGFTRPATTASPAALGPGPQRFMVSLGGRF
jgi:hypothetical protein